MEKSLEAVKRISVGGSLVGLIKWLCSLTEEYCVMRKIILCIGWLWPTKEERTGWSVLDRLAFVGGYLAIVGAIAAAVTFFIAKTSSNVVDDTVVMKDWDEQFAEQYVLEIVGEDSQLRKAIYGGTNLKDAVIDHAVYDTYYVKYANKEAVLVVVVSKIAEAKCHVCGVHVSIFELSKTIDGWSLDGQYINVFNDGQWGEPYPMKVLAIGRDIFGLVVETDYMQHGITSTRTRIFAPVNGEIKEVFSARTGEDYTGFAHHDEEGNLTNLKSIDKWTTIIEIDKTGDSFYDLHLKQAGEREAGLIEAIYKFDGNQYSSSEVYK